MLQSSRDLLGMSALDLTDIEAIFERADTVQHKEGPGRLRQYFGTKLLASFFFEPSLRTQASFEAAMLRLGGKVLGVGSANGSRANSSHEESMADAARVMSSFADLIVFRHSSPHALNVFVENSDVPVINAGNGNGVGAEHPSQALCDLYTIHKHFGRVHGLSVSLLGNLQKRAIRSLIAGLAKFEGMSLNVQDKLAFPLLEEDVNLMRQNGLKLNLFDRAEDVIASGDVIYHGGLTADWQTQLGEDHFLTAAKLRFAREHSIVMHPLPRPGSIAIDVDTTRHAKYFQCAANGVPVRMAVLESMLSRSMH
jgi:aspartate carbamoyltransferase catalytic subunit